MNYITEVIFRLANKIRSILLSIIGRKNSQTDLIHMTLSSSNYVKSKIKVPTGYKIRQFEDKDIIKYYLMLFRSDIGLCSIHYWKKHILSNGFFVVEDVGKNKLVGAIFAAESPRCLTSKTGTIEFLVLDPSNDWLSAVTRPVLAYCLAALATERLLNENFYSNEVFCTNVVKNMYKKLGWKEVEREEI
ncbi:hypothetical protein [Marinobacterium sp. LSUCC0821]|uniref:hypothetical protein n=1 Tax=Marinobacterium sp. LSUCC0821 TaxID=2668067 RepID=UPI00145231CE|nr:hypothetical protein [Marinobacterium sp. LSUCC0821]QJD72172.1 hypothetical protein HH196_10915 [Marinobacterium sp. LSUCC0821]